MGWETAVIIGLLGTPFYLTYLGSTMKGSESTWVKVLFLFLGLGMIIGVIRAASIIAEANNASVGRITNLVFTIYVPTVVIVGFFLLVFYVVELIKEKRRPIEE